MIKIKISKTLQSKIRNGYPWVFNYQVLNGELVGSPGDLAVIYDNKNKFLALGIYDPFSELCFRVLTTGSPKTIDHAFFNERLQKALEIRRPLEAEGTTGYRIINGENDGFPGLILDRYRDSAVVKIYSAAWVPYLKILSSLFKKELPVQRCILRMSRNAKKDIYGMGSFRDGSILFGTELKSPVLFEENGLTFEADIIQGQKTGFFLDQRDNRLQVKAMSEGKRVLNVFSYSGAFSVYAFAGGAKSVTEIDSNPHALKDSKKNLQQNFPEMPMHSPNFEQLLGDGFEQLAALHEKNRQFDLVILDPPAFARNKSQTAGALMAYRRLAKSGAQLTAKGQILMAASCSAHVSAEEFYQSVFSGISSAGKRFEEILRNQHALDHPVTFREGTYLKAVYIKIFD
jgi:23S rRNA (cytosine1962-C5)-methyltransferase